MKILFNPSAIGTRLADVPFGSVVTRLNSGDTVYLVASPMDGSGRRVLITLGGGTLRDPGPDTRVFVHDATLIAGEVT
jgi:hypothetical protein